MSLVVILGLGFIFNGDKYRGNFFSRKEDGVIFSFLGVSGDK